MRVGTGIIIGSTAGLVAGLGLVGWGLSKRKHCIAGGTTSSIGEALASFGSDPIPTDSMPTPVAVPAPSCTSASIDAPIAIGLALSPLALIGIAAGLGVYLIEGA